jgi:hypothetical protein
LIVKQSRQHLGTAAFLPSATRHETGNGGSLCRRVCLASAIVVAALSGVVFPGGTAHASPPEWTITSSVNPSSDASLLAVSCTSSTNCVAVGAWSDESGSQTLTESWDGSNWAYVSSPNQGTDDVLNAVSCTTSSDCVAVGSYKNGSSLNQTLIESWDGSSWSLVSSPNQGSSLNQLQGVSCTSSSSCQAVGYYLAGSEYQTLIESWDGSTWTIASSPDQGAGYNFLYGVSCTSSSSCQAVGSYDQGSVAKTLIESFDGTSWTVSTSPNQGSGDNTLSGVSCTTAMSTTSCQAVGNDAQGSVGKTLVESFDGTSWTVSTSPNQGNDDNVLRAVSCSSSSSCAAVGDDAHGSADQTLAASFDGSSWTISPSPNHGGSTNRLFGVSCTSSSNCVAAGFYGSGPSQTLIETLAPSPPEISDVSPSTGLTTGGTSVTISGTGFTGTTAVDFGGVAATGVVVHDDSSITATSPASSAGVVDVSVTTSAGTSSMTPADQFTYTVDADPTVVPCDPDCTDDVSTPLDATSVSAQGSSGSMSSATMSLVVNTDTLSCGSAYNYPTAVSTLSTTGFAAHVFVTVTETVGNEPSTKGVKVCFQGPGPKAAFLKPCKSKPTACVQSLMESSGSVVATFKVPASDPRFWTGGATLQLKSFSPTKAPPGAHVTIKGKNLTEVKAVVIGGAQATITKASSTKLTVTVPNGARTGPITVTADSGRAVSQIPFTVT